MYTLKERILKTLDIYRVYITVIVLYLMKFIRIIKKKFDQRKLLISRSGIDKKQLKKIKNIVIKRLSTGSLEDLLESTQYAMHKNKYDTLLIFPIEILIAYFLTYYRYWFCLTVLDALSYWIIHWILI